MSRIPNESTLGSRLKRLRTEKSWSQVDLAEAAGMTQSAISRLEQGIVQQPRLPMLSRLANAFGVTVDYLVGKAESVSISQGMTSDPVALELIQTYERLNRSRRQQLLEYAQFLKLQEAKSSRKKHA